MNLSRLKRLRKQRHISQQVLADHLGVSAQSVANYENLKYEPDIPTLLKLAAYFDVSVDYLIGASELEYRVGEQDITLLRLVHQLPEPARQALIEFLQVAGQR